MKPIRLRITGLNSFREPQEIDFNQLCEAGVFGIFGPTGSGKSSILDAITLALYGTVERAANNTQGILNHAEEQLSVEYHFALGVGPQRKVYRAERSYKRAGDKSVKAGVCRLVELSDEVEQVLASKSDEITKKIEEILGLTADDFKRAVVLPQGKFAEFLTIKPKDRREMLERIFGLEAYGKELTAKVSDKIRNAEFDLNGLEQRQQGLGDASTERVKEAENELQGAISTGLAKAEKLTNLKQQYDQDKEVWVLQEELKGVEERERKLAVEQQEVDTLAQRWRFAENAEMLRPILEDISMAEGKLRNAQQKLEQAVVQLAFLRVAKEEVEQKWVERSQRRTETEPQMQRRIQELDQALALEQEISKCKAKLNEMRQDYEKSAKLKRHMENELTLMCGQIMDTQQKQLNVKTRINEISIDHAQRSQVNAAAKALEAYQMIWRQVEEAKANLAKAEERFNVLVQQNREADLQYEQAHEQVEATKDSLAQLQQTPPVKEDELSGQTSALERLRALLDNTERAERELQEEQQKEAEILAACQGAQHDVTVLEEQCANLLRLSEEASGRCETLKAEVTGLEQSNLAGLLVKSLVEGEACPVCGSQEHPHPAPKIESDTLIKAKEELTLAEAALRSLENEKNKLSTKLAVTKAGLSVRQESLQTQQMNKQRKGEALSVYRRQLPESDRSEPLYQLVIKLGQENLRIEEAKTAFQNWKTAVERARQSLEAAQSALAKAMEDRSGIRAQTAAAAAARNEIESRWQQLLNEQARLQINLDSVRGEIEASAILGLQEQYAEWDKELAELNKKITGFDEQLSSLEEGRKKQEEEKTKLDLILKEIEIIGREANQQLKELEAKRNAITNGGMAADLLSEAKEQLFLIVSEEESGKAAYEQAKQTLIQAEQDHAVSEKEVDLASKGFADTRQKLEQALIAAEFLSTEEAKGALCDLNVRQEMRAKIDQHQQDQVLLRDRRVDTVAKLHGRSLSLEEWNLWPERVKEAEKENSDALERRGAALNMLNQLKEKHAEWVKIEDELQALRYQHSLLKTLYGLFRGNSFVEYMAEEQLVSVAIDASQRLGELTNHRYALEVDSDGGFIMRDDANGGARRPVSSLSGGETFLTSLALALALSTQIQLRGESPLEFFFLDEGFGTLDPELLEVAMNTLEKLHLQNLTIGIISHVPELKSRLPRRIIVTSAQPGGAGSQVRLELA